MAELKNYLIVTVVKAPAATTFGNDAAASGLMGAFEPNEGFELVSMNIVELDDEDRLCQ